MRQRLEALHEVEALRESDNCVMIAMDDQDRRPPTSKREDGRGGNREPHVSGVPSAVWLLRAEEGAPIVRSMDIHTSHEERRIARQRQRSEIPTVRVSPNRDARRIDIGPAAQVPGRRKDILIFGRALWAATRCQAEGAAISGA